MYDCLQYSDSHNWWDESERFSAMHDLFSSPAGLLNPQHYNWNTAGHLFIIKHLYSLEISLPFVKCLITMMSYIIILLIRIMLYLVMMCIIHNKVNVDGAMPWRASLPMIAPLGRSATTRPSCKRVAFVGNGSPSPKRLKNDSGVMRCKVTPISN